MEIMLLDTPVDSVRSVRAHGGPQGCCRANTMQYHVVTSSAPALGVLHEVENLPFTADHPSRYGAYLPACLALSVPDKIPPHFVRVEYTDHKNTEMLIFDKGLFASTS